MLVISKAEAGRRLAAALEVILHETPVIIALTPGGASVGAEVARLLSAPFDILMLVRLEVPGRTHSMFGAVGDYAVVLLPERVRALGLPQDYVASMIQMARTEAERVAHARRGTEPAIPIRDRTVVLVDDGSADSTQMLSAAMALRQALVGRLIVASPLLHPDLDQDLHDLADERVHLEEPSSNLQVRDPSFSQTTEFDIQGLVSRNRKTISGMGVLADRS